MAAGIVVQIDRYAQGTAMTDRQGRVVVLLPAALVPEVAPGRPVELGDAKARVVSSGDTVLYPAEVRRRYGLDVASPSVAVVTSAEGVDGNGGVARVLIERDPVIVALIPGLDELFGDEDG